MIRIGQVLFTALLALVLGGQVLALETEQAREAIAAGALVIDVRSSAEYDMDHWQGASHIPHDEIASRQAELPQDKSTPIVLYCRSGKRAGLAQQTLTKLGYTRVFNAGGLSDLQSEPEPMD